MKPRWTVLFTLVLVLCCAAASAQETGDPNELRALAQQLAGASLSKMPPILEQLGETGGERVVPLLRALLEGDLYKVKSTDEIVLGVEQGDGYAASDALDGTALGEYPSSDLKKLRVNNSVRVQLRGIIARLTLGSDKVAVRKEAVRNILERPDEEGVTLLRAALLQETDATVADLQRLAIALYDINHTDDPALRLESLQHLEGSVEPDARNTLLRLVEQDGDGNYLEPNPVIRARATALLQNIESKVEFYELLETIFFGLSLGSVLLLVATGLAITFGVMGVINMAHGELIMLGAYTTYVVQQLMPGNIALSILVAIPAAFVVSGLVGIVIERGVIRFLHGRPLETLLATFGISLVLQQAVRTIFSPLNRQVATPDWMFGSLEFNAVFSITYNRLYVLLFALLVFFLLQLILKKTPLGLQVRAVSQNRDMARSVGIRTEWVDAMTFGLGSGVAGLAGVALSQLTNVGPNLGQAYIIDSFMVVVFGGVGNLWGTLVGGFTLGITNKFLEPVTGAVLANILVLVFIILFIQKRPRGLFPQKGRAAE